MLVNSPLFPLINKNILADSSAGRGGDYSFITTSRGSFIEKYTEKNGLPSIRLREWAKPHGLTYFGFREWAKPCGLTGFLFGEWAKPFGLMDSFLRNRAQPCGLMQSLFRNVVQPHGLAFSLKQKPFNHFYWATKQKNYTLYICTLTIKILDL